MDLKNNSKLPEGIKNIMYSTNYSSTLDKGNGKSFILSWNDDKNRTFKFNIEHQQFDETGNDVTIERDLQIDAAKINENIIANLELETGINGVALTFLPFEYGPVHDIWIKITIIFEDDTTFEHIYHSKLKGGDPHTQTDANKTAGGG
jgi:hypothetical protein